MAIHFDMDRMERVKETYDAWWNGTLDRPLLRMMILDAYPLDRPLNYPYVTLDMAADFSMTPECLIDTLDQDLSTMEFLADGFPFISFSGFGPGILAAMCGAKLVNKNGNNWMYPEKEIEIEDIHVKYNPDNVWTKRIKEIYRVGFEKWDGLVIMGMPDLGGVLDIAASLRGTENLMMDFLDSPDEVKRLSDEIHQAWYDAYADFRQALAPQRVNADYPGLLSTKTSAIIQCDLCHNISNPMFREFVLDTIREDTERLSNVIYHLDGEGELIHLDDILGLEKLKAIQWVYGFERRGAKYWMPLYEKILKAEKNLWLQSVEDFFCVMDAYHAKPYFDCVLHDKDRDLAKKIIEAR